MLPSNQFDQTPPGEEKERNTQALPISREEPARQPIQRREEALQVDLRVARNRAQDRVIVLFWRPEYPPGLKLRLDDGVQPAGSGVDDLLACFKIVVRASKRPKREVSGGEAKEDDISTHDQQERGKHRGQRVPAEAASDQPP